VSGRTIAWVDGKWGEGNVPLMGATTHGAWLASTVFDGARAFARMAPDLDRHAARCVASAKAIGLAPTCDAAAIERLAWEGIDRFADDAELYIRPMFWAEDGFLAGAPESTRFALILDEAPLRAGVGFTACLGRLRRPGPEQMPTEAKCAGLYVQVGRMEREAKARGFDATIVLDPAGNVAEFTAANLFVARDGVVATPATNRTFLDGITRQRVIALLREAGRRVEERTLTFEEVREADEVFATGNYAKIRPCVRIEDRDLQPGPVAAEAWRLYRDFARRSFRPRGG
jgi:branched-chain amino acid aminotransferase